MERSWVKLFGFFVLLLHVQYSAQQNCTFGYIRNTTNGVCFRDEYWFPETECSAVCNGLLKLSRTDDSGISEYVTCNFCEDCKFGYIRNATSGDCVHDEYWFSETECSAVCNGILKLSRLDDSGISEDIACKNCEGKCVNSSTCVCDDTNQYADTAGVCRNYCKFGYIHNATSGVCVRDEYWFSETECSAVCNGILKLSRTDGSGISEYVTCNVCGDPVFLSNPFLNADRRVKVGHFNIIYGCVFETYFELKDEDIYFLKDNTYKISATSSLESGSMLPPYRYRFGNLRIKRVRYSDHGYYQCAINIVGHSIKEIKSGFVGLQLPDTSNTNLILKLNRPWSLEYLNQSSATFKDLKIVVEESIKQVALTIAKTTMGIFPTIIVQITALNPGCVNVISRLTITNVSESMKLQLSNAIIQNISVNSFKQLDAVSVELISLDYCPKNSFGDINYKGEYTFEQTLANQVVQQNCTYQSKGVVRRKCVGNLKDGPVWETPDLSQCEPKSLITKMLIQLREVIICVDNSTANCSSLNVISKNLSDIVNSSAITNYHDVSLIANTLETIVNASVNTSTALEQVFKDVLETIDCLLESNATLIAESQVVTSSSTSILKTLTMFAELYSKQTDKKLQISDRNIAFHIEKVRKGVVTLSAQQLSNDSVEISFENIDLSNGSAIYALIQIPSEVFSNESEVIHSYFFRYNYFFLNESSLLKLAGKNASDELQMQSTILSATVGSQKVANLTNPIILTFKRIQPVHFVGISSCQFWDGNFETNIKNVFGAWLKDGCYNFEGGINNDEFYTCACDHLTNFALLLDVSQSSNNRLGLKIITFIGCGISLVGLSLTLLTLFAFRNLRQKLPSKILMCFCISLSGLLLTFLTGAEKTSPRRGCQVVAVIIHFFILSTFCWMLVEAFSLYRSFVTLFKRGGNNNFLRNAGIFAWGVPAIIVIIAAILKSDQLGNDKVCVLRGYPFYFGVLLPICLILLVVFVVLVVMILSLTKRVSTGKEATAKKYYLSQARIAFVNSALLGFSWLFAVLAVKDLSTVFQWLFCITISLQGFFIFVFYILRNIEAKIEWQLYFRFKEQYPTVSSTEPGSSELNIQH